MTRAAVSLDSRPLPFWASGRDRSASSSWTLNWQPKTPGGPSTRVCRKWRRDSRGLRIPYRLIGSPPS